MIGNVKFGGCAWCVNLLGYPKNLLLKRFYSDLISPATKSILRAWCKVPEYFYTNLIIFGFLWQIFIKILYMKFHGIPSSESRADTYMDRQTDVLAAWYHFSRKERFYGPVISPATMKNTWVFTKIMRNLAQNLTKFGFFRQFFISPQS